MRYDWIGKYLMEKPRVMKDFKEEWRWARYLLGGRMFVTVYQDDTGKGSLITMKLNPVEEDSLQQQYEDIIPGYYMNRGHQNSIKTEGSVPDGVLKDMLDKSYHLILGGLSKKKQKELLGEAQMGR